MISKTNRNVWFIISLCLLAVVIVESSGLLYYYPAYISIDKQYKEISSKLTEISWKVDILVEYSNRTKAWYNQTIIPIGWSLFNASLKAIGGNIEYSTFLGSPFITSINGVKGKDSYFWLCYIWNATSMTWKLGESGADKYIIRNNDIIAWYLVDATNYPNVPKP